MDVMINVRNGQPGAPWGMGSMTGGPAAYREPRTQDTRTLEFGGSDREDRGLFSLLPPSTTSLLFVCLSVFSLAIVLPVLAFPAPFALLYFVQLEVLD